MGNPYRHIWISHIVSIWEIHIDTTVIIQAWTRVAVDVMRS